jgi:hypothetical protein
MQQAIEERRDCAGIAKQFVIVAHFQTVRRVNNQGHVAYVDHHAIDVRSVLGTVQGSSLRSARA